MTDIMKELLEERQGLYDLIETIDSIISGLRKRCKHEWEVTGHDSHKDRETCTMCDDTRYI